MTHFHSPLITKKSHKHPKKTLNITISKWVWYNSNLMEAFKTCFDVFWRLKLDHQWLSLKLEWVWNQFQTHKCGKMPNFQIKKSWVQCFKWCANHISNKEVTRIWSELGREECWVRTWYLEFEIIFGHLELRGMQGCFGKG